MEHLQCESLLLVRSSAFNLRGRASAVDGLFRHEWVDEQLEAHGRTLGGWAAFSARARINKKTFYRYYPAVEYLLAEVQAQYSWPAAPAGIVGKSSHSDDRARVRPTAMATERIATANRAQIPQSASRGPMTSADIEAAVNAPEIAWLAQ